MAWAFRSITVVCSATWLTASRLSCSILAAMCSSACTFWASASACWRSRSDRSRCVSTMLSRKTTTVLAMSPISSRRWRPSIARVGVAPRQGLHGRSQRAERPQEPSQENIAGKAQQDDQQDGPARCQHHAMVEAPEEVVLLQSDVEHANHLARTGPSVGRRRRSTALPGCPRGRDSFHRG